jgi:glycosyltransferase involved in cell wall biosynthesis
MTMKFERSIKKGGKNVGDIKDMYYFYYYRRLESTIIEEYDRVITISPIDASVLGRISSRDNISIIPNGVDTDKYSPLNYKSSDSSNCSIDDDKITLVFFGNYSFQPNKRAIDYIMEEIYPNIIGDSKFEFLFIGPNPPKINHPHVETTGWVDDLGYFLNQSDIAILPFFINGGMKNKILESMAMELPVVTTPTGAESFSSGIKETLIIKSDAKGMINSIQELSVDADLRAKIGKRSREKIKSMYSWESTGNKFENVYNNI